jgi:rRNA-processing protein FCF1
MTIQVVLDTNIIIFASEGNFNLSTEIERIIPQKHDLIFLSTCMNEFNFLTNKEPKMKRHKRFATKLLKTIELVEYNPSDIKTVDKKIIQYAKLNTPNCVVVTNDNHLKKLLREENIPVIFVKTYNHLELLGNLE